MGHSCDIAGIMTAERYKFAYVVKVPAKSRARRVKCHPCFLLEDRRRGDSHGLSMC